MLFILGVYERVAFLMKRNRSIQIHSDIFLNTLLTQNMSTMKKKSLKIAFLRASMARICEMDRTKADINLNKCGKIADIIGLNENAMQFKFSTKILAYILVGRIYCSFELMN